MKKFITKLVQNALVDPNGISKLIGKWGYQLHTWANNYNFDMNRNGELALLKAIAPFKVQTVLDVGAYKGHWSLAALPVLEPESIHAFEPVPRSFGKLQRNLGGEKCAMLNQIALGAGPDTIQIIFNQEKPTRSGFHARTKKYDGLEIIDVDVIDGDTYCRNNDIVTIDMLKIDAEGHEKHVLNGFEPMLATGNIRAIQFEYSPVGTIYDVSLWQLYELFEQHGYVVGKIFPDGVAFAPFDSLNETILGPNYCAMLSSESGMIINAHAARRTDLSYVKAMGGPDLS